MRPGPKGHEVSRRKRYDEKLAGGDGGEWLLESLKDEKPLPVPAGDLERRLADGIVRWSDIESDVNVMQLGFYRCSVCGKPAKTSILDLQHRTRTLLCGSCHPRPEPGERSR